MAITSSTNKSLNPVSSAFTNGLIPSSNVIVLIDSWADALEPRRTPITQRCKKGKAFDQVKLEWGQNYHVPVAGSINEALDTTETQIDLTAGSGTAAGGNNVKKWDVIEIIDYVSGSTTRLDYSTREEVYVTAVNSDTSIDVVRGNGSGTGVAHSSGAYWAVCGSAMPYNTDFELSPFVRGDKIYNHPQRFAGMVAADIAAQNTPQYGIEGNPMLYDLKEETLRLKWQLERTVVSGERLTGNGTGSGSGVPHKMGGILYYLTNHSGRVNDLGGRTISAYDLEDVIRDMFKEIDDGGAKTLLMGPDTAAIFDMLLNPIRMATAKDDEITLGVNKVNFRWGSLEIMATQHMPEGRIAFVDFKDISLHPYKGLAWSTKKVETSAPVDKTAVFGDYSLKVDRVTRMGLITNFNTELTAYPRREVF